MTTWYGHLLWVVGASVLSMAVAAIFAGILELPRNVYLVFYFASVGALLYGYVRWSGVDLWKGIHDHWVWGLLVGAIFGFFTVQTVLIQPSSPTPQGAHLVFDLVWLGLIYGAVDALLLSVLPVYATWRAMSMLGWTEHWYGKVGVGALALVASMFVIGLYHVGYPEFRGPQVLLVVVGVGVQSLGYLLSRSPLAPVVSHVAMHVAAVLYGIATVSQLPPH
jgi:hypothetical protein